METEQKTSRFNIQKLEDRIAPTLGLASIGLTQSASVGLSAGVNVLNLVGIDLGATVSESVGAGISL